MRTLNIAYDVFFMNKITVVAQFANNPLQAILWFGQGVTKERTGVFLAIIYNNKVDKIALNCHFF